jgi:hypothetical protein
MQIGGKHKMHFQLFQAYTQNKKNIKSNHTLNFLKIVDVALSFTQHNYINIMANPNNSATKYETPHSTLFKQLYST